MQQHSKEEPIKRIITAAAIAAILATIAACGGDDGNGREERLHPVLHDVTYQQIEEGREYVTMTSSDASPHLSDRINALHQGGYEIEHTTRNSFGRFILIFRKIPRPEESVPPVGTTPAN